MNKKIILTFLVMFCAFFGMNSIKADTTTVYKYCYGNDCRYLANDNNTMRLFNNEAKEIYEYKDSGWWSLEYDQTKFIVGNKNANFEISDLHYSEVHCVYDSIADAEYTYHTYSMFYVASDIVENQKQFAEKENMKVECNIKKEKKFLYQYSETINANIESDIIVSVVKRIKEGTSDIYDKTHSGFDATKNIGCAVLSNKMKDKINWVLNLIKYGGAALVIVLGSLDFLKATLSDEDNASKKAFERFIKRLIAAILLFLLPLLIQLLFTTINNPAIKIPGFNVDSPTCGIGVSE